MVVISLNCQSVRNKIYEVLSYLDDNQTEIACLQETWLNSGDQSIYQVIREHGYHIIKKERSIGRGGGLAIIYKCNLMLKKLYLKSSTKYVSFDFICSKIPYKGSFLIIINLYRPPYSKKHPITVKKFIEEFQIFVSEVSQFKGFYLILGDFNINMKQKDSMTEQFTEILKMNNFVQLVDMETHVQGGLIDLIIFDTRLDQDDIITKVDKSY